MSINASSLVPALELRSDSTMFPVIRAQQVSGQSVREFCREQDLSEHVFHYWRKKYRDQCVEAEGFVRLDTGGGISGAMRMNLGNGRSLDFTADVPAGYLAELINQLA